jgi:hypothetical protein
MLGMLTASMRPCHCPNSPLAPRTRPGARRSEDALRVEGLRRTRIPARVLMAQSCLGGRDWKYRCAGIRHQSRRSGRALLKAQCRALGKPGGGHRRLRHRTSRRRRARASEVRPVSEGREFERQPVAEGRKVAEGRAREGRAIPEGRAVERSAVAEGRAAEVHVEEPANNGPDKPSDKCPWFGAGGEQLRMRFNKAADMATPRASKTPVFLNSTRCSSCSSR